MQSSANTYQPSAVEQGRGQLSRVAVAGLVAVLALGLAFVFYRTGGLFGTQKDTCAIPIANILSGYWDSAGDHSEVLIIDMAAKEMSSHVSSPDGEDTHTTEYRIAKAELRDGTQTGGELIARLALVSLNESLDGDTSAGALCGEVVLRLCPHTLQMRVLSRPKKEGGDVDLGTFTRDNFMSLEVIDWLDFSSQSSTV